MVEKLTAAIGRITILATACIGARAEIVMVDPAELGEGFAGYFGYVAGSHHVTPVPPPLFDEPISRVQYDFTTEIEQPRIDVHYQTGYFLDQGPAESFGRIDAIINSVAGMPTAIRGIDIVTEVSALAPVSLGMNDAYISSAQVQFNFLFEVTDDPVNLKATGTVFADPYAYTELRITRMDASSYTPTRFPDVDSLILRSRTFSNQQNASSGTLDSSIQLDPGMYFLFSSTSVLRSYSYPGTSLASQSMSLLFGGNDQRWIDPAGGLFSDGDNWESGVSPSAGDPILFDLVNDGYVVEMDTDADVSELNAPQGTVSLRFNGNTGETINVAGNVVVGETAGVRGGLDVIGGTMHATNVLVGRATGADGLLTLREGAVLEFDTLQIGQADGEAAQFYALSGASLAVGPNDVITVAGSNSSFEADQLTIGEAGLVGATLNVESGGWGKIKGNLVVDSGLVLVGGQQDGLRASLQAATDSGSLRVEADGAMTISDGELQVGDEFFNASAGMVVNAAEYEPVEYYAAATVASLLPPAPLLPEAAVQVIGQGSSIDVAGTLAIGADSNSGLLVAVGGALQAGNIVLGSAQEAGVNGNLVVRDAGSSAKATTMVVGTQNLGSGNLHIKDGANVEIAQTLDIGNGELRVSGPAPAGVLAPPNLMVGTDFIASTSIGEQGRLFVTDGGSVQIGTSIFDLSADLIVDADSDAAGIPPVQVSGAGSSLHAFKRIGIGEASDGHMAVTSGGSLTAFEITLGNEAFGGVAGQLDVAGVGSNVFTQQMLLGDVAAGSGTLTVSEGASVAVLHDMTLLHSSVIVDGSTQGTDSQLFVGETNVDGSELMVGVGSKFVVSAGGKVEVGVPGEQNSRVIADTVAPSSEPTPFRVTGNDSSLHVHGSLAVGLFDDGEVSVDDGGHLGASLITIGGGPQSLSGLSVSGANSSLTASDVVVGGASGGIGILELREGSAARVTQHLTVNINGSVSIDATSAIVVGPDLEAAAVAGTLLITPGGELSGTGAVLSSLVNGGGVNNLGIVSPGNSPGTLTIHGDYEQGDGGVLVIEVGGTQAGVEYDVLDVLGDATIGGEVLFEFVDGFLPRQGQAFDFLIADGNIDLTMAVFGVANLGPGFQFEIQGLANGFRMLALNDATPVPLPAPAALFAGAITLMFRAARRRGMPAA